MTYGPTRTAITHNCLWKPENALIIFLSLSSFLIPRSSSSKTLIPDLHRNSMAKNKSSSSSSVCHHSPPASPPTMVEDFGSLSLGCFSFSRPPWPHTLSRLSLSLLSHRSSKAPTAWTRARTPSQTHSHSHRGFRSHQSPLTVARQPPWPWTRALKLSPSHSYGSKPHGFDDGTTVMRFDDDTNVMARG